MNISGQTVKRKNHSAIIQLCNTNMSLHLQATTIVTYSCLVFHGDFVNMNIVLSS